MNKKVVSIILLIFVLSSLLINVNFVSAQGELAKGTQKIGSEIWNATTPILKFLFNIQEEAHGTDAAQTMLSFIFAFIIVFVFLLLAFKNIPLFDEYPGMSKFIIVVASLLGIRGIAQISPSVMSDIFMPYSVAALSIINGAIIVGWFVLVNIGLKGEQFKFLRRFMWILFAVIFIGVWWTRTLSEEGITGLIQWTYWATIILSFIMALLDGSIQSFFAKIEADKIRHTSKTERRAAFAQQIKDYRDMVREGTLSPLDYNLLKKQIQRRAKVLGIKRKL